MTAMTTTPPVPSDALPPLPEPAAQRCLWVAPDGLIEWEQWHHDSDPMPAKWDDEPPTHVVDHFTAAQMHAFRAEAVRAALASVAPAEGKS